MQPNETLFLESTQKPSRNDVESFINYELWDFPGSIEFSDLGDEILTNCGAMVFVIDAQDGTYSFVNCL